MILERDAIDCYCGRIRQYGASILLLKANTNATNWAQVTAVTHSPTLTLFRQRKLRCMSQLSGVI